MKITIASTVNGRIYDVYFNLQDEKKLAPLERIFRDTFVKDLYYYNDDLDRTKISMNARSILNINIYSIIIVDSAVGEQKKED